MGAGADNYESIELPKDNELGFAYTVNKDGQTVGYAGMVQTQGYGGPIEVVFGMDTSGGLLGIAVGGSDFKETEGLGTKTREPDFTDQFVGKTPPLELGKDIDAVSGATVSSRAVTQGVNEGADALTLLSQGGGSQGAGGHDSSAGSAARKTANASVMGYGGPVLVTLTLDDAGKITRLMIGGDRFSETDGVGSKVREEGFAGQFIGKAPPLKLNEDVDAVSGATVSSQAAVDAVNKAAEFISK